MGLLRSTSRFILCKTEQEEESERPLLPHPTLHQHYLPNGERSPKIVATLIYNAIKGLLQSLQKLLRFIVSHLGRPSKDPILPVQNPATTIVSNNSSSPSLTISSSSGVDSTTSETPPAMFVDQILQLDNAYVVSSQEWPNCNISATRKQSTDLHLVVSDEIIGPTVFLEEIGQGGNVPAVVEESCREIKGKEESKDEREREELMIVKNRVVVWFNHYSTHHRILLVGEGDFSFSASLAVAFGTASNIIATSLDSIEFLKENYRNAPSNIEKLRSMGCRVMHGIDATQMANHSLLGHLKFDRVIFNFPFAGFFKDLSRESQLRRHRRLVSLFMKNAKEMVTENGEIHISHKTNGFHIEWKLGEFASSHRLGLIEAVKFNHRDYPGYNTKCGFGGDNYFNCNPSLTYKFGLIKSARC